MATARQLSELISNLTDKRVTTRRKAIDYLTQSLIEETNALPALLTKNSLKINKAKSSENIGWHQLILGLVTALNMENAKKWVLKSKQMYQSLKLIIDIAEDHGHFLENIIVEIIKLFKIIMAESNKLIEVGGYLFEILLKIMKIPIYQSKIKYGFYKELFVNISNAFSPQKDNKNFDCIKAWRHCSKHHANILANLLCQIMQSIESLSVSKRIQFINRYIVPFYCAHFDKKEKFDNAAITAILLKGLNDLLSKYAMNVLSKYDLLCLNALAYFDKLWSINLKAIIKRQMIKFINLFFEIHRFVPCGVATYDECMRILLKIYPKFEWELNNVTYVLIKYYGFNTQNNYNAIRARVRCLD